VAAVATLCLPHPAEAQNTLSYIYTGNPFSTAFCERTGFSANECVNGNITASVTFNNLSPGFTGTLTSNDIASFVIFGHGNRLTFTSSTPNLCYNGPQFFSFSNGVIYDWALNVYTSNAPCGVTYTQISEIEIEGGCCGSDESYYSDFSNYSNDGTFTLQVGINQDTPGTWSLGLCPLVHVSPYPSFGSQYMEAAFVAPQQSTLTDYEAACGFSLVNWVQEITTLPVIPNPDTQPPNLFITRLIPNNPKLVPNNVYPANCSNMTSADWMKPGNTCSMVAGPSPANGLTSNYPPLFDGPPGGYTTVPYVSYPFYDLTSSVNLVNGLVCTVDFSTCPPFPNVVSTDNTTLSFLDDPFDPFLLPTQSQSFLTELVGVDGQGNVNPLFAWRWTSDFNGMGGGVSQQTTSIYPIVPGSGTGGVTITNINGVQLPPVVPSTEVATTASGLAYSRVSQTFNGTVTLRNISGSAISGPLQIVFFGMPATVTLVNATANLSGTPYLTVPAVASPAPGQSVTVNVQVKNPSNVTLNLTPVIYSGSIN